MSEPPDASEVTRYAVVAIVSTQFLAQLLVLLPDRHMQDRSKPFPQLLEPSGESLVHGLLRDHEGSAQRPSPVMCEPQEVE